MSYSASIRAMSLLLVPPHPLTAVTRTSVSRRRSEVGMREYWRNFAVLAKVLPVPVDPAVLWFHRRFLRSAHHRRCPGALGLCSDVAQSMSRCRCETTLDPARDFPPPPLDERHYLRPSTYLCFFPPGDLLAMLPHSFCFKLPPFL